MPATLQIQIIGQDDSAPAFASLNNNLTQIPGASDIATGALRHIGEIGVDALGQAAGAVGGFVKDSVSAAATFESNMNTLGSVLGDSLGQAGFTMDDVTNKALQLGAETSFSAAQAQEAMIALAKGGVPVKDMMDGATDAALNLASAGGVDLAQAADIVAKNLGVWGETGVNAAQVSNLLAQAANASTVDVDELALGLANVGGAAKSGGVDFQELTQTMGLIAPNFSSASDAGTALKTMILNLSPSTKPATEAMIELGMATADGKSKFFDASGSFIGMDKAAGLLQSSLAGLGEEQRMTALKTIFGADAIRAADAIARAGTSGFNAFGQAMTATGSAADQAGKMNTGYTASMNALKGSVETIQIVLGTALLPILTNLITTVLTPGINVVLGWAQALTSGQVPLQSIAALLTGVKVSGVDALALFMSLQSTFGLTSAQTAGVISAFTQVGQVVGVLISAAQPLVGLLQANLVPILAGLALVVGGAVVAAMASAAAAFVVAAAPIMALVAVGALLYSAWSSNFGGIQGVVTSVLGAVWGVVSAVVSQITAFWATNGATILADVQRIWGQLQVVIGVALQLVQTIVVGVLGFVATFVAEHGALIQQVLGGAWQVLSSIVEGALALIGGIIRTALALIQGDWDGAWQAIQDAAAGFVTGLVGVFEGAVDVLGGAAETMIAAVTDVWASFTGWSGIGGGVIDGIISGITGAIGGLVSAAANAAKSALDAAKSALGIASPSKVFHDEVGAMIPAGVADGIRSATPEALNALADLADKLIGVLSDGVDAFGKLGSFGGVSAEIMTRFGDTLAKVVGMINVIAGWFKNESLDAAGEFADTSSTILSMIGDAIDAFKVLPDLVVPSTAAMTRFGDTLAKVVGMINVIAGWFKGQPLADAADFADSAATILDMIGGAVESLNAIADLVVPTPAAVVAFGHTLAQVVGMLAAVAQLWQQAAIDRAAAFADGAGKALAIISGAVDGFLKLRTLAPVPAEAWGYFADGLTQSLFILVTIANQYMPKAIELAGQFGEGAGKALAIISGAVDGFLKLATFQGVPASAMAAFQVALQGAIAAIGAVAQQWTAEAIAAAATFAESAGKVVSIIGGGVDGLTKLIEFKSPPEKTIEALRVSLDLALTAISGLAASWDSAAIAAAASFASAASQIISMISGAIDGFVKLTDLKSAVGGDVIKQFGDALRGMLAQLVAQVLPASVDVGTQIVAGIARGLQSGAPTLAPILAAAVDQAIGSAIKQLEDGSVTGATKGSGGGSRTTTTTTTTNHNYTINGYNQGQAGDLTSAIRQMQLLQDA
mgnify:CR=1 FL=1